MPAELHDAERKLAELILYVSAKCAGDPNFGAVKLNKILFQADFFAYAEIGHPMTGVEYAKHEFGPAPRVLVEVREALERNGDIAIQRALRFLPKHWTVEKPMVRVIPLRDPDLSRFTPDEIALVDQVIEDNHGLSGSDLSEWTHTLPGWVAAEMFETIPYETVFLSNEPPTAWEREHGLELAKQYAWPI